MTTPTPIKPAPISLSASQIAVMSTPTMVVDRVANLLIYAGLYENRRKAHLAQESGKALRAVMEYERAVFTHWALDLVLEHGADWQGEAAKIISALYAAAGVTVASKDSYVRGLDY
jgi:hypothetical protein